MARLMGWHANHQEFFTAEAWAGVAAVFSINSRNALQRPLIPSHLSILQAAGIPVIGFRDEEISAKNLDGFRVITIENAPCLNEGAARRLARWVRKGGVLIASPDTGAFDELGRKRSKSSFWRAFDLDGAPQGEISVGSGKVIAPQAAEFAHSAMEHCQPVSFRLGPDSGAEIVSYRRGKSLLLHVVRHVAATNSITLHLPDVFHAAKRPARIFIPGSNDITALSPSTANGCQEVLLTNLQPYFIVQIPLR
jgi:hypothetical protein